MIIIHVHKCSYFYGTMLKMTLVVILIFVTIKKLNTILFNKILDKVYEVLCICHCCLDILYRGIHFNSFSNFMSLLVL